MEPRAAGTDQSGTEQAGRAPQMMIGTVPPSALQAAPVT
jgi:hypothetical protein